MVVEEFRSRLSIKAAAIFLFSILLLAGLSFAQSGTSPANALWVGESHGALKLSTSNGDVLLEVAQGEEVHGLALNSDNGDIWAYSYQNLYRYQSNGQLIDQQWLGDITNTNTPSGMVIDPPANRFWVAVKKDLYRYDLALNFLQKHHYGKRIGALSLDSSRSRVWVAAHKEISVRNADGTEALNIPLAQGEKVFQLAYDPILDQTWAVVKNDLRRYDSNGFLVLAIANGGKKFKDGIAPDGAGGLWGIKWNTLAHAGSDGVSTLQFAPYFGATNEAIHHLSADRSDQSIWITNEDTVKHYNLTGQELLSVQPDTGDGVLRYLIRLQLDNSQQADTTPPSLIITNPTNGSVSNNNQPTIDVSYSDAESGIDAGSLAITVDGQVSAASCTTTATDAQCNLPASLADGNHILTATIADQAGNTATADSITITLDTQAPQITITQPTEGAVTNQNPLNVSGSLNENAQLVLNGNAVQLNGDNSFATTTSPLEGANVLNFIATDAAGNVSTNNRNVFLDTAPPAIPQIPLIDISDPLNGQINIDGQAGSVEVNAQVQITNLRTGETIIVTADADGAFSAQMNAEFGDQIQITVLDAAGNQSQAAQTGVGTLPPDPATIAPPLPEFGSVPFDQQISFLYTGADPIQTGVNPNSMMSQRLSVIRGQVRDKNNNPLPGVTVSVKDHPEFGQTQSRVDGMFDMTVNGGGVLTVDYRRPGYIPIQRQIKVGWGKFAVVAPAVMIPRDLVVTSIDLTNPGLQVARGSVVSDSDGSRQGTLMFTAGTTATMTLPDGTTQAITDLDVRVTEFTVGANGPETMPAELPPTSAYTYAIEVSIDQAEAVGATQVNFNQTVPYYLENFIGIPTGYNVPVGYYDYQRSGWVPELDGRVLEIIAIDVNNRAVLDVDGSGVAASAAQLAQLGISDAELSQLAGMYAVGASLWRIPMSHFSVVDCNFGGNLPSDAETAGEAEGESNDNSDPECSSSQSGCIIEIENQVLGEEIAIVGTPFTAVYRSHRTSGAKQYASLDVRLTGNADIPESARGIAFEVEVAGRYFAQTFPAEPNQTANFVWDGVDAYGRPTRGLREATVRVGFIYDVTYGAPQLGSASASSFGGIGLSILPNLGRDQISLFVTWKVQLGLLKPAGANLGSWAVDVHHDYDPLSRDVYLGTGRVLFGQDPSLGPRIETIAGSTNWGYAGDGGPASAALFNGPEDVAVAANGSIYIADWINRRIRKISPNGTISTFAGTGVAGSSGDGGPANQAQLVAPQALDIGPDGSVYILDTIDRTVRRVNPDGIINTVAGTSGVNTNSGDGGPATAASLANPWDIAVADDGTLFIATSNRIRRVDPLGYISTYALISGSLALGSDGALYVAGAGTVKRIGIDGGISTYAGTGGAVTDTDPVPGDSGPAVQASLARNLWIEMDTEDNLYIAGFNSTGSAATRTIRVVRPDGIIYTLAGGQPSSWGGRATSLAINMSLSYPRGLAVDPQGDVYFVELHMLSKLARPQNLLFGEIAIPSKDGREIYTFDGAGMHQRTLDALTGAERYRFDYDSSRNLISLVDPNGDITTIERNASGIATGILSHDGQRTNLTVSGSYLTSISNPAGETHSMQYSSDGLMTRYEDPRTNVNTFVYDAVGRLNKDNEANGGNWTLARTSRSSGKTVTLTSELGRTSTYATDIVGDGDRQRTITAADGSVTQMITGAKGQDSAAYADGTQISSERSPDLRFGARAPVASDTQITTPSGLNAVITGSRNITLSDPNDPLSITSYADVRIKNGRSYQNNFNPSTLTWTRISPTNRRSATQVDAQQRPISYQITGLDAISYNYDSRNRLAQTQAGAGVNQRTTNFNYYSAGPQQGYLQSITDAENRTVTFDYDLAGRVTQQTLPDNRQINYTYDANGNLSSIQPPGRPAHVFNYDNVDQQSQYTPPAISGIAIPQTTYSYNLDKQLTDITRPDGQRLNFNYNPSSGQLASTDIPRGSYNYLYDPSSGQLTDIIDPQSGSLSYNYDGFLPTNTTWGGSSGISGNVSQSYSNDFNLQSRSINGGSTISYSYDNDELLTQAGSLNLSRNSQHGLITGTTLNTISTTQSYSGFAETQTHSATYSNGSITNSLYSVNYTRDRLGRITQKQETLNSVLNTYAYRYDLAGRLDQITTNGTLTHSYSYDPNGNRLSATENSTTTTGSYDDQDRLTAYGANTYTYSDNGELQSKTDGTNTTSYNYDVLGNLMAVTLANGTNIDYIVDGQNRRIGKRVNGSLSQGFLYKDQLNPIAELNPDGSIRTRFVYADKINVPAYMIQNGITYRIISDHLGSPRLVVNTTDGTIAQQMDYDAWGNVTQDTNPGLQPFGFAGGIYDLETNLTRFGARDYDPQIGRWTSKDPILFAGGDTNLFGYVLGDPINFVDLDGLAKTSIDAAVEQAVMRGNVDFLQTVFKHFPHNLKKEQQRRLLQLCKQNKKNIKAETHDVKAASKKLREDMERFSKQREGGSEGKANAIADFLDMIGGWF